MKRRHKITVHDPKKLRHNRGKMSSYSLEVALLAFKSCLFDSLHRLGFGWGQDRARSRDFGSCVKLALNIEGRKKISKLFLRGHQKARYGRVNKVTNLGHNPTSRLPSDSRRGTRKSCLLSGNNLGRDQSNVNSLRCSVRSPVLQY